MSDPQPGQRFSLDSSSLDGTVDLRPAETYAVDTSSRTLDDELPATTDVALDRSLARPRKRRWGLLALLGGSLTLGAVEAGQALYVSSLSGDLLSGAWSALGLLALGLGGSALLRELFRLRRLRRHAALRERLTGLDTASGHEASRLAERLREQMQLDRDDPHWQAFLQAHQMHHDGNETQALLSHHLLAPRDREARRLISRMSGDTAIMVAVSPLTLVDMMLVAWRNLAMLDRIAALYGLELGYASRLKLFRSVLANMAFAGTSEMVSDASMQLFSMNLAGKLSTRAGQGLSVGLLSARLGLRAMRLMRPLPFDEESAPRIGDLRSELWQRLRRLESASEDERQ
ncbi:TIGR01620 family protein [Halomonas sp. McH1-25]|uniref:TIGR01620 family protein n=1 Tax=unclassified Halomonas TaxID=2609666 RepID=UPI001EF3FD0A|nr:MULTISPECIES: TIGR01620 family protein [unclassified Halomonas]MCG7600986.1 TIGR01620 family protein [Halomonas sp. McH1-25]MCP1342077.1 TIGR01620 family protein [Halomonas sp. FL8]MCP1359741.1 TIGR01620 family protein [Halomonas sp. BBD45]MCP1364899.1 TIGR01620 family protein [Halomonas sp. BBD48]